MSDRARRIVVSGVGAVSGHGWGVGPLWDGLRGSRAAIRRITRFDASRHRTQVAAEAPPGPDQAFPGTDRHTTLADRFALAAGLEALAIAGLPPVLDDARTGVFFGSSTGGFWESEEFYAGLIADRRAPVRVSLLASQQANGPGDALARALRVRGPVETVSAACASGTLALGLALDALRSGEIDRALVGGADSLCELTHGGFNALRSVDERPCLPFRAERQGLSIGEGAAVLVLEDERAALARGARPLADLLGCGASCDAHHMTAPDPEGVGPARAMAAALEDAGVDAAAIDFVNAHGTGTPLNDAAEWAALSILFGDRAHDVPVTSTKGAVGHLLGSAGAIEALATVLCLAAREVHPTPGDGPVDPAAPVRLVLGAPLGLDRARPIGLSTSLAFGGSNAAVVLARHADGGAR